MLVIVNKFLSRYNKRNVISDIIVFLLENPGKYSVPLNEKLFQKVKKELLKNNLQHSQSENRLRFIFSENHSLYWNTLNTNTILGMTIANTLHLGDEEAAIQMVADQWKDNPASVDQIVGRKCFENIFNNNQNKFT